MLQFSLVNEADFFALQAVQQLAGEPLNAAMAAVTFLGNPLFWVMAAAAVYWKGRENESFFLMNLVLFAAAAAGALKFAFARPRPAAPRFKALVSDAYSSFSFPSGHATLIAGAFSYCWGFVEKNTKAVLAVLVALVAFSRIYLGMHFPSDVIAGIALGLAVGRANLFARNRLFHRNFRPTKMEDELALIALVAAAVLAVVFLQPLPLAAALIGYYAGFFIYREMGLQQSKTSKNLYIIKSLLGFALLGAALAGTEGIAGIGIALSSPAQFALYLVAGFWVSWGWPVLWEEILHRKLLGSMQAEKQ